MPSVWTELNVFMKQEAFQTVLQNHRVQSLKGSLTSESTPDNRQKTRTEEEVKFVKSCLQEIESSQSYSSRLQFLLAEVVHFKGALVIF
ncbi:uncharacterized protein LJ206_009896 isoform 2-T3 [Theristicus caerulescens]